MMMTLPERSAIFFGSKAGPPKSPNIVETDQSDCEEHPETSMRSIDVLLTTSVDVENTGYARVSLTWGGESKF